MNNPEFWKFFETDAYPNLKHRQQSLRYVLEYLDRLARPFFVVETCCVRNVDTWSEEGQSTILFDRFVSQLPGSIMHSVDLDPEATALCRSRVSSTVQLHTGDSVALHHMKELVAISTLIGPQTLVVVDDSPLEASIVLSPKTVRLLSRPIVSGKAKYVADYAETIGLAPVFTGYQAGWI